MKTDNNSPFPPLVSIVGKSGSGKTTFLEKLIRSFKNRGYRVGTIKHHLHDFEMDQEGKDSWRHKHAGAEISMISSPYKVGMVMDVDQDPSLEELIPFFSGMDIILSEGHKKGTNPKVEIFRNGVHKEPVCRDDRSLIALVTDTDLHLGVPRFSLDDVHGVAKFLVEYFKLDLR
jgi:molybdopterin-guanine dinucleotide biosynthesis protein B